MSEIHSESMRNGLSRSIPALMISATLLSVASIGCMDDTATATDESEAHTSLSISDLRQSGLVFPGDTAPSTQSLPDAFDDLLKAPAAQSAGAATNAIVACSNPGSIRPFNTNLYVSAQVNYTGDHAGMLRAGATKAGPWESFQICRLDTGEFVIFSNANGLFVSAEFGYTGRYNGMLRARATQLGPWEKFVIVPNGAFYTLQTSGNFLFVSTEFGYDGGDNALLRARAASAGPWERYNN